jgi:hypothetical protein
VAQQSSHRVHHLLGDLLTALHDQLLGDLQSSWQHPSPR